MAKTQCLSLRSGIKSICCLPSTCPHIATHTPVVVKHSFHSTKKACSTSAYTRPECWHGWQKDIVRWLDNHKFSVYILFFKKKKSRVWWLTPVIPATLVETGRVKGQGQLGQNVSETPSQSISWVWWPMPVIAGVQEATYRKITV
jgi:hypothetical protein